MTRSEEAVSWLALTRYAGLAGQAADPVAAGDPAPRPGGRDRGQAGRGPGRQQGAPDEVLVAAYESGLGLISVAGRFGVRAGDVRAAMRRAGKPLRSPAQARAVKAGERDWEQRYAAGESTTSIARSAGLSRAAVRSWLARRGEAAGWVRRAGRMPGSQGHGSAVIWVITAPGRAARSPAGTASATAKYAPCSGDKASRSATASRPSTQSAPGRPALKETRPDDLTGPREPDRPADMPSACPRPCAEQLP